MLGGFVDFVVVWGSDEKLSKGEVTGEAFMEEIMRVIGCRERGCMRILGCWHQLDRIDEWIM